MKSKRILFYFIITILLCACSANQHVYINKDGSGECSFSLRLEKPVVEYILDIAEVSGLAPDRDKMIIFDTAAIEKALLEYEGVTITGLSATHAGELLLSFQFENIDSLVQANDLAKKRNIIRFGRGEETTISLHLERTTVNEVLGTFLNFKTAEFDYLLPRAGETREAYYENLDFAVDGGATLFKNSILSFSITVNGTILRHNGTLREQATVLFSVPVDTLLFLNEPIDCYVVFK